MVRTCGRSPQNTGSIPVAEIFFQCILFLKDTMEEFWTEVETINKALGTSWNSLFCDYTFIGKFKADRSHCYWEPDYANPNEYRVRDEAYARAIVHEDWDVIRFSGRSDVARVFWIYAKDKGITKSYCHIIYQQTDTLSNFLSSITKVPSFQ